MHASYLHRKRKRKRKEKEKECLFELNPFVRESMYKKQLLILINKSDL